MNSSSVTLPTEHAVFNATKNGFLNETIPDTTPTLSFAEVIEEFIYTKAILGVCLFGIGGNLLNLIVLSQRSLLYSMKRMEKSAHYGLIALAVSDLLVCLATLPNVVYGKSGNFAHASFDFRLVHKLYGVGVINTFMLSSTWLTVTMAVSRYIAICHPLKARQIIGKTFTVASLVAVILGSVLFNVPRFLNDEPRSIVSAATGGSRMYFVYLGPLRRHPNFQLAYSWTYFTLGIAVPLCVLVFCNTKLVVALRTSKKLRDDTTVHQQLRSTRSSDHHHHDQVASESASRITLTLIVIIILFVLLFIPVELLTFFIEHATDDVYHTDVFNIVMAIGNLMQASNFAVNFVLYCIVNTHFRHTMYRLAECPCCRENLSENDHARATGATVHQQVRVTNVDEEVRSVLRQRAGERAASPSTIPLTSLSAT